MTKAKLNQADKAEIVSIQYLRGVAAMSVVVYHTLVNMPGLAAPHWLHREIGDAGIDIFFVISGFVMFYVTRDGMAPREFLRRRIVRIVPLYWIMTLFVVLLAAFSGLGKTTQLDLSHIVMSLLFIPHINPSNGGIVPLLKPGFTLNYEMYFYLVFALALLVPTRGKRLAALAAYGLAVTAIYIATFPQPLTWRVPENPIILEFVAGAALGWLYVEGRLAAIGAGRGLALLIAGFVGLALFHVHDSEFEVIWHGVPATLIVAGALAIEAAGRTPKIAALKLLGDASYSIYLFNAAWLSALNMALLKLLGPIENIWLGGALTLLALGSVVVAGYAIYRLIELPATRFVNGLLGAKRGEANKGGVAAEANSAIGVMSR